MMTKVVRYLLAYGLWILNLVLTVWIFLNARQVVTGFLALFYQPGDIQYSHAVEFADKVVSITLGLGWLAFSIVTEDYFRKGIDQMGLWRRGARVTGPVLLIIFAVDLALIWLQGTPGQSWIRWLILAAELSVGLGLVVAGQKKTQIEPTRGRGDPL
jgi:hypothetical protein